MLFLSIERVKGWRQRLLYIYEMKKYLLLFIPLILTGCQSYKVKEANHKTVTAADSVILCRSLLDKPTDEIQSLILAELKRRKIDSCLSVIAHHECPYKMQRRQKCLDEKAADALSKIDRTIPNHRGTEILIRAVRIGAGIIPF